MQTAANPENESPGALACATGATITVEIGRSDCSPKPSPHAIAFGRAVANLPPAERLTALEHAIETLRPGEPPAAPFGIMAEARSWASWASRSEIKAYAAACIERMTPADMASFLGWAAEVAA